MKSCLAEACSVISITLRKCCNLASNSPTGNSGANPDLVARRSEIYAQDQMIGLSWSEVTLAVQETGQDLARAVREGAFSLPVAAQGGNFMSPLLSIIFGFNLFCCMNASFVLGWLALSLVTCSL